MNKKYFLIIAIATLLTVCAWVVFDVLHARANVEIDPKISRVLEPLNPNFDQESIQLLK